MVRYRNLLFPFHPFPTLKIEHTHSSETFEYFQPIALSYISNFCRNKRANLKFHLNIFILFKLLRGKTFEKMFFKRNLKLSQ
jgi:hypothetical protein